MFYVVHARRSGKQETHSYLVGVFTEQEKAIEVAETHANFRGGQYSCEVCEMKLDVYDEDAEHQIIYTAKSRQ